MQTVDDCGIFARCMGITAVSPLLYAICYKPLHSLGRPPALHSHHQQYRASFQPCWRFEWCLGFKFIHTPCTMQDQWMLIQNRNAKNTNQRSPQTPRHLFDPIFQGLIFQAGVRTHWQCHPRSPTCWSSLAIWLTMPGCLQMPDSCPWSKTLGDPLSIGATWCHHQHNMRVKSQLCQGTQFALIWDWPSRTLEFGGGNDGACDGDLWFWFATCVWRVHGSRLRKQDWTAETEINGCLCLFKLDSLVVGKHIGSSCNATKLLKLEITLDVFETLWPWTSLDYV